VSAETKLELLGLIDSAVGDGWAHARACRVLDLADVRAHRWRQRLREPEPFPAASISPPISASSGSRSSNTPSMTQG